MTTTPHLNLLAARFRNGDGPVDPNAPAGAATSLPPVLPPASEAAPSADVAIDTTPVESDRIQLPVTNAPGVLPSAPIDFDLIDDDEESTNPGGLDMPALLAPPGNNAVDEVASVLITSATPVILGVELLMAAERTHQSSALATNETPHTPHTGDGVVCPFCAHVRPADAAEGACPRCTMQDTASTRRSTGERIGPWFVLQRKNPTAPGLRFSVLLTLARRGHVTPRSIVRGPTTGQLWRYAAQVKGLSRQFGVCWHCGAGVSPDGTSCPRCRSAQEIPDDPDTFLESYASLPVMREAPQSQLGGMDDSIHALPAPLSSRDDADDARNALTFWLA